MPNPSENLITLAEAAKRLSLSVNTIRRYCNLSRKGKLVLNGTPMKIRFYQTGSRGQGRILIDETELATIREAIAVKNPSHVRSSAQNLKHIDATPGRPK